MPGGLFNSTLTLRLCDGEWYHLFHDFCCFRCQSHCVSKITSVYINWCFVHSSIFESTQ